jgi:hypothetical protein
MESKGKCIGWLLGKSPLNLLFGLCFALVLFGVCSVPAHGQVPNSVFTGTVTDPQSASVPDAEVKITNLGTGQTITVKTNSSGGYRAAGLPVGTYKISVTATGFKTAVKTSLPLAGGAIERVDFELVLGAKTETVLVEAGAVMVETEDSRLYETVTGGQVANLPLNGRNVFDLIQMAPGALNVTGVSFENGHSTVVNGLRPNFIGFLVNGASDKGLSGGVSMTPNADIVQEFQELTLNMSAQYGNSAGAVVNIITKSGTNTFHGSLYEFLRNDALDANDFFRNKTNVTKPALRFNQFGGVVTGPIWKDKLFFTASYQGERFTTGAPPVPVQAESPQWRQAIISALPNSAATLIYKNFPTANPGTPSLNLTQYVLGGAGGSGFDTGRLPNFAGYLCPNNSNATLATGFGNLVGILSSDVGTGANETSLPASQRTLTGFTVNPTTMVVTKNCATYFGTAGPATRSGLISRTIPFLNDNVLSFGSQTQGNLFNGNEWSTRIDWVRKNDRVFGEFYWQKATDSFGPANASSGIHGFKNPQEIYSPNFQASWVHPFSPNWVNEARVGYSRNRNDITTSTPGVPSIGFDDTSAGFGSYSGYPQLFRENVYSYGEMMSFVKGKHNIKAGADFRRNIENSEFSVARPSYYFFDQLFFAADSPYAQVGGVDPGFARNAPAALASNVRHWRNLEIGAFIQDDWKVRRNLTLNIGLRYDLFTRHTEKGGLVTTFIPGPGCTTIANGACLDWIANANVPAARVVGDPLFPGCNTADQIRRVVLAGVCGPGGFAEAKNLGGSDHNNFGPRVGFAWDPFSKGKTAIRGGFGVAYEGTLYNPLSNSRWNPPFYSFNLTFNPLGGGPDTVVYGPTTCTSTTCTPSGATPTFSGPPTNPGLGTGAQATGNIGGYFSGNSNTAFLTGIVFPEGIKDPYVLNYYFGIQQEILPRTVLEVNYVGTQGHKLFRAENANRAPGIALPAGTVVNVQGRTLTGLGRRFLNPNYGRLRVWENVSKSWYNALQATLRRQMSHGLMFNVTYAWSHSIDTGSTWHSGSTTANGAAAGEGFSLDQTRPELDRGNSIFDIRHRMVFNYVWELPWYKDQKGVIGHVLGGWQYNGIWSFQSGAHFSPFCATGGFCDFNKDGERNDRPDAPNGNTFDVSREQWASGWFASGLSSFDSAILGAKPFFGVPCAGCNGNLGRNTFTGPGQWNTDMSVFKNFKISERFSTSFRVEMFNAFNHANFTLPNSATGGNRANRITSSIFGKSNGTLGPRRIQFGLKLLW